MGGRAVGDREVVAAVDCGTNSTRLLVADDAGTTLAREVTITRLGQGVDRTKRLADAAVERTVAVLRRYRRKMDDLGVTKGRQVATSAVRDATNGEEFLRRTTEATGLRTEVLSGLEEASLSLAGATGDLAQRPAGEDVVVDIGGGSTELAVAGAGQLQAVSLDIGCVRLTERYLRHDPPSDEELTAAGAAIAEALEHAVEEVPALGHLSADRRLLGLAGTVATLARLAQGLVEYDRRAVHHFVLLRQVVDDWLKVLAHEPAAARLSRPGMSAGREDVIVGGVAVLAQVMARFGFEECLVSESDILDGMVAKLLSAP
jgi:exopolyphosphatase/guanosine-5'-triphosphate,3'-diphosphate pyrophosphatase